MSELILATKLYIPLPRSQVVFRPRLFERLNEGLRCKLTLISAPAGFGKSTLVSEWVRAMDEGRRAIAPSSITLHPSKVAWLSLDQGDSDLTRFLTYLVAALQTCSPSIGQKVWRALQAQQPPPTEWVLTTLLNQVASLSDDFIVVLDDYYLVDAKAVDVALAFLLEHLPPQMHLVIATREDPQLPLAQLRAKGQLTELRASDLRFTPAEAAEFLNRMMHLNLSAQAIAALETRTEGWIAGLQLAAVSMQGLEDTTGFIQSFTGSHRFVMDYLVDQVLNQQSDRVQTFLLRTSILNRLCGSLCEALLQDKADPQLLPPGSGQDSLEYLERANLFIVPLDNERRWYRYHHLFSDLLRQRLHQSIASSAQDVDKRVNELHLRASQWYEDNNLELEAFHHAAAANDIERAERLVQGKGIPLHLSGAVKPILDWLASLPATVLDARPSLRWRHASLLLVTGQTTGVEEKLQAAEAALQGTEENDQTRNLIGRIAVARSVLALTRYDLQTILAQSHRALEYLSPDNLFARGTAYWTLGFAYVYSGDRAAARRALDEAISLSRAAGDVFTTILATIGIGILQEADNQLYEAAQTYQRLLQLAGDQPLQIINEVHLGLARILYEWNDLQAAEQHGRQALDLARQYDRVIDRFVNCEVFLARIELARGDVAGAAAALTQAEQSARQKGFVQRIPEIAAAQALVLVRQGNLAAAAQLAKTHHLPLMQARVNLAQDDTTAALAVLEPLRQEMEAKGWSDEQLKVMILQAVGLQAHGENDKAVQVLGDALALAEPGGFIRIFVDEGRPMAQLLSEARDRGMMLDYIGRLLAALDAARPHAQSAGTVSLAQPLVDPLSPRELEILRLIAQGLSNDQIGDRLFLALSTVKGHNLRIFSKLQVKSRTEAVARARALGLL